MKANKLTPGSNMRWESSRMMLPEHKERILQRKREQHRKDRPILDEQEVTEISSAIWGSMNVGWEITLTIFGEYVDREVTGRVEKVDTQLQQVKIITGEDFEWIAFRNVIKVST